MRNILFLVCFGVCFGCGEDNSGAVDASAGSGRGIGMTMPEPDSMVVVVDSEDAGMSEPDCREGERIPCEGECGVQICMDGEFSDSCEIASELCNGIDDDCDENIDENYEANGLGFACQTVLENNCLAQGVNVCSDSATSVVCEAEMVSPEDEICDGRDNDCDDAIDEDFPDRLCCVETYQCPLGNLCIDGECQKDDGTVQSGGSGSTDECSNAGDCPFGEYCENGRCVSAGGVCLSDSDCLAGNRCEDFICVPGVGSGACTYDFECESNEVCEAGQCVPNTGFCYVDADCESGFECVGLVCVPTDGTVNPMVDFCSSAVAFSNTDRAEGSTDNAADVIRPSCAFRNSEAPDLVYRWRPQTTGAYTIDTNGSGFDTVIALFDNCSEIAQELQCDDDGGDSTRSAITVNANAFQTYYIVVSGYFSTASGNTVVNVNLEGATPPDCTVNSDCDSGERCLNGQCEPVSTDGFCDVTTSVSTNVEQSGTTQALSNVTRPSCGMSSSDSPDAVFRWRPTRDGVHTLSTAGSDFDTVLAVYEDCSTNATDSACNDDGSGDTSELEFSAEAFQTYFVVVTGYKTQQSGDYVLNISDSGDNTPECTLSSQCDSNERCENGNCIVRPDSNTVLCDHFRDESLISADYPQTVSGTLGDNFFDNCGETSGNDFDIVWYPILSGTYAIRAESTGDARLVLGLYRGCNDFNGERVLCEDEWASFTYEETAITVDVEVIEQYRIVVSGQGEGDTGSVRVTISAE